MSANKSPAGLSLMALREIEHGRFFTIDYLKETGARLFLVCRDCHRWRELWMAHLPDDIDIRFPEGRFRCVKCDSKGVVIGITRGERDPGPPRGFR